MTEKIILMLVGPFRNKRGYALITSAVVLILVAGVMGYFLSGLNIRESSSSAASLQHMRANYLAMSGLDWVFEYVTVNNPVDTTFDFADGSIQILPTPLGADQYNIVSRGMAGEYEKELSCRIRLESNQFFPDTSFVDTISVYEVPPDTITLQDPNVVISHIVQGQPTDSLGKLPYFTVGQQNPAKGESRILVQFNLDPIPITTGSQIDTAILILNKVPTHEQNVHEISVHKVTNEWRYTFASWNYRMNGLLWTSSGGDYGPELDRTYMTSGGEQYWDVTSSVRDMINNPSSNYGWLLRDPSPQNLVFSRFARPIPPKLFIVYRPVDDVFIIGDQATLNGDLYTGMSMFVVDSTRVGQAPLTPTTLYVPPADTVFRYSNWEHTTYPPRLRIYYPKMTALVDSLDSIALSITGFSGNRYLSWSASPTVDLSNYQNNTIFVKNFIIFNNVTLVDMPKSEPGFIISAGYISSTNSHFGDNIVIISNGSITLNSTTAGSPFRPPNENIVNMFWSTHGDVTVGSGSTLYCNLVAFEGRANLASTLYGGLFVGDLTTFTSTSAYLEGALWTKYFQYNTFNTGQMNLTGYVPDVFAGSERMIYLLSNILD